ncbi:AI-2E family transporter [Gordonia sp. HY002]|uniref:AI-2E family transporter n=1 Tax=Gordonia zhenghanii TaxID=2911516 RepID=UPI001EEF8CB4|nr:AI-2E family transporter [Gordonia zhenghanii]MCF8571037.1 AI-2E family transporter [Gordonia zhenghanii]MCF8606381.1 AI-2E family transporter [Gordonia zhenghanii]
MAATSSPGSSPAWAVPRGLAVLAALASLTVTTAGIKMTAGIVGPVFLALILVVAVHPAGVYLRKHGWPTWLSAVVVLVALYGTLALVFVSIVFSLGRLTTIIPSYTDRLDDLVGNVKAFLHDHGVDHGAADSVLGNIDSHTLINAAGSVLSSAVSLTSTLVLIISVALFLVVDSLGMGERTTTLRRVRPNIAEALIGFAVGTRRYLLVTTVFGFIVAVLDSGVLWAIGIPLPILWGLLSFITNYIPNIGFVLGVVPPAILGLLEGGPGTMLLVIVIYSVINVVLQSFVQPKFVGDAVGLSTTVTFLSLVVWAWILGPLGAILAVPLTIFVKALLIDIDPATRWMNIFIADSVPPERPTDA